MKLTAEYVQMIKKHSTSYTTWNVTTTVPQYIGKVQI